jgi:hypothetical protein
MNIECRRKAFYRSLLIKKDRAQRLYPSKFDSAESFDSELFEPELTIEEIVAGCGSLALKLDKA